MTRWVQCRNTTAHGVVRHKATSGEGLACLLSRGVVGRLVGSGSPLVAPSRPARPSRGGPSADGLDDRELARAVTHSVLRDAVSLDARPGVSADEVVLADLVRNRVALDGRRPFLDDVARDVAEAGRRAPSGDPDELADALAELGYCVDGGVLPVDLEKRDHPGHEEWESSLRLAEDSARGRSPHVGSAPPSPEARERGLLDFVDGRPRPVGAYEVLLGSSIARGAYALGRSRHAGVASRNDLGDLVEEARATLDAPDDEVEFLVVDAVRAGEVAAAGPRG